MAADPLLRVITYVNGSDGYVAIHHTARDAPRSLCDVQLAPCTTPDRTTVGPRNFLQSFLLIDGIDFPPKLPLLRLQSCATCQTWPYFDFYLAWHHTLRYKVVSIYMHGISRVVCNVVEVFLQTAKAWRSSLNGADEDGISAMPLAAAPSSLRQFIH